MRKSKVYPLSLSQISQNRNYALSVFKKIKPHKGTFIDVVVLEGSFLCDDSKSVYESLEIGETLFIRKDEESKQPMSALFVFRQAGEEIGKIPFANAILPNLLLERGIHLWCYAESKSFNADILEIAVSIYCENY